ncbi:MAG: hypothetical protein JOZ42_01700 [Acetobacteraceae bacterium]|nr:hypothetical protein [Acetobacteraceae bacterium]
MTETSPCLRVGDAGAEVPVTYVWQGAFSEEDARAKTRKEVCIQLVSSREVTLEIPNSGLYTEGHVLFPDGHEEGDPGGVFFDEALPQARYVVSVGQRSPVWQAGSFSLKASLK